MKKNLGPELDLVARTPEPGREPVRETWLKVPIAEGEWIAAYRLIAQAGQVVVGEVRVFPSEGRTGGGSWVAEKLGDLAKVPPGGLQTRTLREVHALGHVRGHLPRAVENMTQRGGPAVPAWLAQRGFPVPEIAALGRMGRVVRDDPFYARIAAGYLEEIARGSRRPVRDLADRIHLAPTYVRDLVGEARKRGLLSKSVSSRGGGELTAKGRTALRPEPEKRQAKPKQAKSTRTAPPGGGKEK
jgi:hypothetical protein